jgi:hypothetical protein
MIVSRWSRDKEVKDLVDYFNQPDIMDGGWERLASKPQELRVVAAEVEHCRRDFVYFARNYAVIKTKDRKIIPFNLWESQELLLEKIYDLKAKSKPQKILICKARQLGFSTVIEAMMAWRVMFFENVNAIIVSHNPAHSVYLFNMLTLILDSLPWILRPMVLSRKIEEGLIFDNPNHEDRQLNPGLKSLVVVQAANQTSGVGQGYSIQAAHMSELGDWDDNAAKEIVDGDLGNAIADNPETFAFIETTAKGEGRYFHRLWKKAEELGDRSEWYPFFVPWFFERNRKVVDLGPNFKLEEPELHLRQKVLQQWLKCDKCGKFREATTLEGYRMEGLECPVCQKGILVSHELSDNQLAWIANKRLNASKDLESQKEYHQELPTTAQEAFVLSGIRVFPQDAMDWAEYCSDSANPIAKGFMDASGVFHGVSFEAGSAGKCPAPECTVNHEFDDMPLTVWEYPQANATYTIGVDVANGDGGDADYSVAFVNKVSNGYGPDEHVATLRSNEIDPITFAFPVAHLGQWYNEACLAIECNKFDTCFSWVRNQLQYTNIYRWKHVDSTNTNSNKWGWWTNQISRPRLYQTAIKFLKSKMWVVRSKNIVHEMNHFAKDDYEDKRVEHSLNEYDDELIAGMIALYTAHDQDYDNNLGFIPIRRSIDPATQAWAMRCRSCQFFWGANDPTNPAYCPQCFSPAIEGHKNALPSFAHNAIWEQLEGGGEEPQHFDMESLTPDLIG